VVTFLESECGWAKVVGAAVARIEVAEAMSRAGKLRSRMDTPRFLAKRYESEAEKVPPRSAPHELVSD
jgi:hypothetical protein